MMIEVSFEDFEKNQDEYWERTEAGETFLIRLEDGRGVVCAPIAAVEELETLKDD